jgi:DNA mismatch repair protein MutS
LEKADGRPRPSELADDLPLFRAAKGAAKPGPSRSSLIEQALAGLSPDAMTPKEALDALYRLKSMLASEP